MKICLQAGHAGRTSGSTGAPSEQKWTMEIVPKIASKLREHGFEVKEVNADPSDSEVAGDWDLFLAVHYDADIYNDRGGFIDIPDAASDGAHNESARIADEMRKTYFSTTGIPEHNERSNANTKFYYMWSRLSAKTPCVILEAGVGFRVEEDWQTLWHNQPVVIDGIVSGIVNALGEQEPVDPCESYKIEIDKLKKENDELQKQIVDYENEIIDLENIVQDLGWKLQDCEEGGGNVPWVEEIEGYRAVGITTTQVQGDKEVIVDYKKRLI